MSEYLLNNVWFKLFDRLFEISNALYDNIENFVGTNFKTATNSHLGYISAFFVRKTVNVMIMNYAS